MIKSRNPEDRPEKKKGQKWDRNPVPCGSQWRGWLAGQPFGAWVHYDRKLRCSKPCLDEMTDHEVKCSYCADGLVPDWRGYTPYYCDQYVPMFVQITFEYLESVQEIPHLAPILIKRGHKATDAITIEQKPWRTTPIPFSKERERPVDLARFLVYTLWGDEALKAWCSRPKPAPQQTTPKDESLINDPSLAKLHRLMDREATAKQEAQAVETSIARVMQQIDTPKPNGVHKKPR